MLFVPEQEICVASFLGPLDDVLYFVILSLIVLQIGNRFFELFQEWEDVLYVC